MLGKTAWCVAAEWKGRAREARIAAVYLGRAGLHRSFLSDKPRGAHLHQVTVLVDAGG